MLIGGIDEAGYGPKLGPLVVSVASVETHKRQLDADKILSELPLMICDSKRAYSPDKGIRELEKTILSTCNINKKENPLENLVLNKVNFPNISVPVSLEAAELNELRKKTAGLLDKHGVSVHLNAFIIETCQFNKDVQKQTKHEYVFNLFCKLISHLTNTYKHDKYVFDCGKLSYRRFYLRGLMEYLNCGFKIINETHETSEYKQIGGNVTIKFMLDAEDRSKPVALASMLAKYIREIFMMDFNRQWAKKYDIKPTSGYGRDANRFLSQLKEKVRDQELSISRIK